jgi:hypothetical protein
VRALLNQKYQFNDFLFSNFFTLALSFFAPLAAFSPSIVVMVAFKNSSPFLIERAQSGDGLNLGAFFSAQKSERRKSI